jgi:hypothetical protein
MHQIGSEFRQPIEGKARITVFDRNVATFDKSNLAQTFAERWPPGFCPGESGSRLPMTGGGRCAPAVTGQTAALPSPAMNSRRLICNPQVSKIGAIFCSKNLRKCCEMETSRIKQVASQFIR